MLDIENEVKDDDYTLDVCFAILVVLFIAHIIGVIFDKEYLYIYKNVLFYVVLTIMMGKFFKG